MSADRIKNAASLLVKGGTLTSEPCKECGGVVVKFERKTVCASCGAEKEIAPNSQKAPEPGRPVQPLESVIEMLQTKISRLATELSAEEDLSIQKQKADLLETYLRILEKVRSMAS